CLTWFPVDRVGRDIFNNVEAAAFNTQQAFGTSTLAYCAQGAVGVTDPFKLGCFPCNGTLRQLVDDPDNFHLDLRRNGDQYDMACGGTSLQDFDVGRNGEGTLVVKERGTDDCRGSCPLYCVPPGFVNPTDGKACSVDGFGLDDQVYSLIQVGNAPKRLWATVNQDALQCRGVAILGADFAPTRSDLVPGAALRGICTDVGIVADERASDPTQQQFRPMLRADRLFAAIQDIVAPYTTVEGRPVDNSVFAAGITQDQTLALRNNSLATVKPYGSGRWVVFSEESGVPSYMTIGLCVKRVNDDSVQRFKLPNPDCPEGYRKVVDAGDDARSYGIFSAQRDQATGLETFVREDVSRGYARLGQFARRTVARLTATFSDNGIGSFGENGWKHDKQNPQILEGVPSDDPPTKPIIASVEQSVAGGLHAGGIGKVTINNQTSGDIVGPFVFNANVSFYGWADHEQSPLHEVRVVWGAGSSDSTIGPAKIQNRKPFCAVGGLWPKECVGGAGTPEGLTCQQDADCAATGGICGIKRCFVVGQPPGALCQQDADCALAGAICQANAEPHFGNAADAGGINACAPTPFSFTHTYTFNADDRARTKQCDAIQRFALGPFYAGRRCTVYDSPKIQVTDWWGEVSAAATYPGRIIAVESR
ncbi:MAG: hypothetical protein Q7S89_03605, partial [bacterium]|nr:hypothetical protein [bacterium]